LPLKDDKGEATKDICLVTHFQSKGLNFIVFGTLFSENPEHDAHRAELWKQIHEHMKTEEFSKAYLDAKYGGIAILGNLNNAPQEPLIKTMERSKILGSPDPIINTFKNCEVAVTKVQDYIFHFDFQMASKTTCVTRAGVVKGVPNPDYPTNHLFLRAVFRIRDKVKEEKERIDLEEKKKKEREEAKLKEEDEKLKKECEEKVMKMFNEEKAKRQQEKEDASKNLIVEGA